MTKQVPGGEKTKHRDDTTASGVPYVAALDGIRALAVIAVFLFHADVAWMPGGFLGVDVFFVLSGFLITSLLLETWSREGKLQLVPFWIRRARRLLPAAMAVVAVSIVVAVAFVPTAIGQTREDVLASIFYFNNWHQILATDTYFESLGRPSMLQHLWSLSIEEQFYLVWPLVLGLFLLRLNRRAAALLVAAAAVASGVAMAVLFSPGEDPTRVYFGTDTHSFGLLLGSALAFVLPLGRSFSRPTWSARSVDCAATVALVLLIVAMMSLNGYGAATYRGGLVVTSLLAAVLIAAVAQQRGVCSRLLGSTPMHWVGRRSYGIYLWHWPVIVLMRPSAGENPWLSVVLQAAVTLLLADLSYRYIEMPVRTGTARRRLRGWIDGLAPRGRLATVTSVAVALGLVSWWIAAATAPNSAPWLQSAATPQASASIAGTIDKPVVASASSRPALDRSASASKERRPLAIGASVMLAASPSLKQTATVDAAVARQATKILARLEEYRAWDRLPSRVIVQIGENGPLLKSHLTRLRRALRGVDRVVMVNVRVPRPWEQQNNRMIKALGQNWPNVRFADWRSASAGKGLLYGDGIHPTPSGRHAYSRLIKRTLNAP